MQGTVYFRSFEIEDERLVYQWLNDDELKRLSIGVNRRLCRDEVHDWVASRMRDRRDQVWWAICDQVSKEMIGYAYLTDIHYINRSANFGGIVIGDPKFQNGIAWVETYLFVLDYAFERLNLHRLFNTCLEEHQQSMKISEVLFFRKEGVLNESIFKSGCYHNEVIWGLIDNDYRSHKDVGDYDFKKILYRFVSRK